MSSLPAQSRNELSAPEGTLIDAVEATCLGLPQIECPVEHFFGPGIYVRQVTIPAGAFVIGHAHKTAHLNLLLSGAIALLGPNLEFLTTLIGPCYVTAQPGRKAAYAITDVVWQNLHATDETDLDRLEADLIVKSEVFKAFDARQEMLRLEREAA